MEFNTLIPSIFYRDISSGIRTFVNCLQFRIGHDEINSLRPFCVLEKDGLKIYLFQDEALANEHHPELRLETGNIGEVFRHVNTNFPDLLHPNLSKVTLRPWGAQEFALRDDQLGVIIQQWS